MSRTRLPHPIERTSALPAPSFKRPPTQGKASAPQRFAPKMAVSTFLVPGLEVFPPEVEAEWNRVQTQAGAHTALPRPKRAKLSFSELAAADLPPLLRQVVEDQRALTGPLAPTDPRIHAYRKHVESLRNHWDLFAALYPARHQRDLWKEGRQILNALYEALGELKDLGPSLTPSLPGATTLLKQRQERLAKAQRDFLKPQTLKELTRFVEKPTRHPSSHAHKRSAQSRFQWGGVRSEPKASKSGLENVRRLLLAQTEEAIAEYPKVLALPHVLDPDNEKRFHDLRKRIRTLVNLVAYFPDVISQSPKNKRLHRQLYGWVSQAGRIEDRLVRLRIWEHATQNTLSEQRDEVDAAWREFTHWMRHQDALQILRDFRPAG